MAGKTASRNFLHELVVPESPTLDIVAVHGLNPYDNEFHAKETWTSGGKLWLRDFLPTRLPDARVLLFGYNSNVAFQTSKSGIREHAENLLQRLTMLRHKASHRPLVFICHSLGGIVVKRALVDAALNPAYQSIRKDTYGIVFFGTPHRGGNLVTLGTIAATIVRAVLVQPSNSFMKALEKDSLFAESLALDFRHQLEEYHILSFYESKPLGKLGIIVDRQSATLGLPGTREQQCDTGSNHADMCKFADDSGDDFIFVMHLIEKLADDAVKEQKADSVGHRGPLELSALEVIETVKQAVDDIQEFIRSELARQLSVQNPALAQPSVSQQSADPMFTAKRIAKIRKVMEETAKEREAIWGRRTVYVSISSKRPLLLHIGVMSPERLSSRIRRPVPRGCIYWENTLIFHTESTQAMWILRLTHLTLQPWAKVIDCSECQRKHTEFYDIMPELAATVIDKWKEWVEIGRCGEGESRASSPNGYLQALLGRLQG